MEANVHAGPVAATRLLLTGALVLGVLAATAPTPAQALRALGQPAPPDPTAPLVAAVALLAWGLATWLVAVLLVVAAASVPGSLGRWAGGLACRIAPRALLRVAEVALGLTVATGAVAGPHAVAETPLPAGSSVSLDWPGAALPAPAAPIARPVAHPAPAAEVVVRPGDTLWGIAADHLPVGEGPAAVAQAWPAWWSANRAAIGADPDLIHPGTRLVPPAR
jgi:nucleoid-associated protein YgaU